MPNNSPLRYPGGKQKLTPFLIELLQANNLIGGHYIEPYAGGAGAAMDLLLSNSVNSIHLNDSSKAVYAFWHSILNHPDEFCRRIISASLTIDEWKKHKNILKQQNDTDLFELGFSTFYLNRVNRSGVLTGGVIGGINQTGNYKMDARFSRNELIRRIESIANRSDDITITNLTAEALLFDVPIEVPESTLIYFDPPYYEKASGLYLDFYKKGDHATLAELIQGLQGIKWILSYDSATQILDLYSRRRLFTYDLQYNAATVYKGKEVFVFCDELIIPQTSSLKYIDVHLAEIFEARQLLAG